MHKLKVTKIGSHNLDGYLLHSGSDQSLSHESVASTSTRIRAVPDVRGLGWDWVTEEKKLEEREIIFQWLKIT